MTDIFLRAGEANPNDVRLTDPTVISAPQTVTPGLAALTITAFAPTVQTPRLVTIGSASLTTASFAPTVSVPRVVIVAPAALMLTPFAPTTIVTANTTVTVGTASLVLSSFAPAVAGSAQGGHHAVRRVLPRRLPPVIVPEPVVISPDVAVLSLRTYPVTVEINDDELVLVLAA